jgi:poly(hydroxyalkanoate) granule-associated protein
MARKNRTTRTTRITRTAKLQKFVKAAAGARDNAVNTINTLVQQTRAAAIDKAYEARDAAMARAEEAKTKTAQAVGQLEKVFETRVSRAIAKLGVPSSKEVRALSRQVAQLQASVDRLSRSRARARAA